MRILKFGGKSLDSFKKTQKICKYIKNIYKNDKKIIIIVSAIGKTTDNILMTVKDYKIKNADKRELDSLLSTGETYSSSLFAMLLNSINVPAKSFQGWQIKIRTKGDFQNSLIYDIDKSVLENCLNNNIIAVISGFQGINDNNEITTLGRGGSDTTAAAIGAIFQTNVELYSDFNGIYSGDPRENKYKKLKQISYPQIKKASILGAKVICSRAIDIAKNSNINIISKSSSLPNLKGTIINGIETKNIIINTNNNLCEIQLIFSQDFNYKFIVKNVIILLNNYKIYKLDLKSNILSILVNMSDKTEIINLISSKINLLKNE